MAMEAVEAVRQAELNAIQTEREANQKKEAIILEAKQKAKEVIASKTKEAVDLAEKALSQTSNKESEVLNTAVMRAEKEILLMQEMLKEKEQAAISYVLSEVI